jgi:hypothetical protein
MLALCDAQASRAVLAIINEKFPAMPFTLRALAEEGEKAKEPITSAQVGMRVQAGRLVITGTENFTSSTKR